LQTISLLIRWFRSEKGLLQSIALINHTPKQGIELGTSAHTIYLQFIYLKKGKNMRMNKLLTSGLLLGALFSALNASAAVVDTIDSTSGASNVSPNYFAPNSIATTDSPYYRSAGEDWQWAHNAIASPYTTATLSISAYDVDNPSAQPAFDDEIDEIYGWETSTSTWNLIGVLDGANDIYSFTTFNLGASWASEIASGLLVRILIDQNNEGWQVTLAKSVLATDGGDIGNPNPGSAVPVPAAAWLFGSAILGFFGMRRRNLA
jgi:hypothetical protein